MIRGIDRSLSGPILQSAAKSIRRNLSTVLLERLPVKTLVVSTAMIALLVPSAVLAEELSFGGAVMVTSNYLSDGLSETGNSPAIQPYFEIAKNGFYAAAWTKSLKDDVGHRAKLVFRLVNGASSALAWDTSSATHSISTTRHTPRCPLRARSLTNWRKRPLAKVLALNLCWLMLGLCTPMSGAPIHPQA